jgi:hypothetical protein
MRSASVRVVGAGHRAFRGPHEGGRIDFAAPRSGEPGIQAAYQRRLDSGFRVRLRFAAAPRNDTLQNLTHLHQES